MLKVREILGDTVGQGALEMVPDKLVRVKLWGVSREAIGTQPGMRAEKLVDRSSLVRGAVIPEEDHGAPQVSEQLSKELGHLRGSDVLVGVKPGIQPMRFFFGETLRADRAEIFFQRPAHRR